MVPYKIALSVHPKTVPNNDDSAWAPFLALLLLQSLRLQTLAAAAASWQEPAVNCQSTNPATNMELQFTSLLAIYKLCHSSLAAFHFISLTLGFRAAAAPLSPSRRLCLRVEGLKPPDMTEKKPPCRWGVLMRQASALGRFKNKLRLKKLEWKRFYEQFWGPAHPTSGSDSEYDSWVDSQHGTDQGSTTTSNYNSQYFDSISSEEAHELFLQAQIPSLAQSQSGQSSVPGVRPLAPSRFQQEWEMPGSSDVMLQDPQFVDTSQQRSRTPWMDHVNGSVDSPPLSVSEYAEENVDEYADTISEWRLDEQMCSQVNTGLSRNVTMSVPMSMDAVECVDMSDTEDSFPIPVHPEHRLQWFRQFLEVGVDEAVTGPGHSSTGRGWRVMVRIVCACRKLSRLLRTKKLQRTTLAPVIVRKKPRGLSEGRSQLYKGVRRRNGKWVSEVRVGQTTEKVWLGSFNTEKEAALAFDAGKYHCSTKRFRDYNFTVFLHLLGPQMNLRDLSPSDRRKTIQRLAEDHAKNCTLTEM